MQEQVQHTPHRGLGELGEISTLPGTHQQACTLLQKERCLIRYQQAQSPLTMRLLCQSCGLTRGLGHMTTVRLLDFRRSASQRLSGDGRDPAKQQAIFQVRVPDPNRLYFSSGAGGSCESASLVARAEGIGKGRDRGYLGWLAALQPHSLPHGTSARSPGRGPYSRAQATPGGHLESR